MNFENGQTVYLKNGEVAVYVQALVDGRHVVQEMVDWTDEDGDLRQGLADPIVISEVFSAAPTSVQAATIARLEEQIDQKRRELRELNERIAGVERDSRARKTELELHDALRNFVLFTQGKITHIVVDHGKHILPTILSRPEACTMDSWGSRTSTELRLITVSGDCKNGTVSLKINQYSDGSGNRENNCFLCTSEEEAKERCRVLVDAYLEHAKGSKGLPYNLKHDLKQMEAWGVEVPTWLLRKHWTAVRDRATAEMNESVEKRDAALAMSQQAEKALEDLSFDMDIPE